MAFILGGSQPRRGEARGLWIDASPRKRSLVKFHLSEFREQGAPVPCSLPC